MKPIFYELHAMIIIRPKRKGKEITGNYFFFSFIFAKKKEKENQGQQGFAFLFFLVLYFCQVMYP
jgi:hypothetical protein